MTDSMRWSYPPATTLTPHRLSLSLDDDPPQSLLKTPASKQSSFRQSLLLRQLPKKPPQHEGYPGDLTQAELDACLEFRKQVNEQREQEPSYYEMVHCYEGVEEEAHALCRFLRARKFVVPDVFSMMTGNLHHWKEGKAHDFYPDLLQTMKCPLDILWTQFPIVNHGIATNGSLVAYFQAGGIQLEALDCLTRLENFVGFIWHEFMYGFKDNMLAARENHPNTPLRFEVTMVIDLRNISRSLFTEKVMAVLKDCCHAFNCFPEVLNKMIIVNAPYFFSALWLVIKQFLDARTVAKIELYSNESKGLECISRYIHKQELLSDYGGKGPSFEQALKRQMDNGACRQMVERFFLVGNHGSYAYDFDLGGGEKATIVVYTKSVSGATFTVSKGNDTVAEVDVQPTVEGNDVEPYSVDIASQVLGPGTFSVAAKSNSATKEYFLVAILMYPLI